MVVQKILLYYASCNITVTWGDLTTENNAILLGFSPQRRSTVQHCPNRPLSSLLISVGLKIHWYTHIRMERHWKGKDWYIHRRKSKDRSLGEADRTQPPCAYAQWVPFRSRESLWIDVGETTGTELWLNLLKARLFLCTFTQTEQTGTCIVCTSTIRARHSMHLWAGI